MKQIPHWNERQGVDYDNRSQTLQDLVDYCNNHEKQSLETLAFKTTTEEKIARLEAKVEKQNLLFEMTQVVNKLQNEQIADLMKRQNVLVKTLKKLFGE